MCRAFSVAGPKLFNNLPLNLRELIIKVSESNLSPHDQEKMILSVKKQLKTNLFLSTATSHPM